MRARIMEMFKQFPNLSQVSGWHLRVEDTVVNNTKFQPIIVVQTASEIVKVGNGYDLDFENDDYLVVSGRTSDGYGHIATIPYANILFVESL